MLLTGKKTLAVAGLLLLLVVRQAWCLVPGYQRQEMPMQPTAMLRPHLF